MGEMNHVLKIDSEFDVIKVICCDYISIKQGTDLIAMTKDEAVKLAEWILENVKNE